MSKYSKIEIVEPDFSSSLTDLIIELDYLRKKEISGSTPAKIFFQLKSLFHTLESIGSARIEGNHTTIAEFIEAKLEPASHKDEKYLEIHNVELALGHIDKHVTSHTRIDGEFIRGLHKIVVDKLSPELEGDENAGEYRLKNIKITGTEHIPPSHLEIRHYMKELTAFMNEEHLPKYDLLKIALAHHRFVWIHPFGNGNGRTVRLLTYAQLVKAGFNIHVVGRIINPTAIFCSDRNKYYDHLAVADKGLKDGLLSWCEYVLMGLKQEIEKIDLLTDYDYLSSNILLPAVQFSFDRKVITSLELEVLKIAIKNKSFRAQDLKDVFPGKLPSHISRFISQMKEKKLIVSDSNNGRSYQINFINNYLLRGVVKKLDDNKFLPLTDEV